MDAVNSFIDPLFSQLGTFLPSLVGAIAILIIGWIVATSVAAGVKKLLQQTEIDNRIASWIVGDRQDQQNLNVEEVSATIVYWLIMVFVLVAFFQTLQLDFVSEPLNNLLQQVFGYIPKLGGAAVLLGVAWLLATVARLIVLRGLQRFNLDDQLAQQTGGTEAGESPFLVNETLANALYWFIFLFFLPLVLEVLDLQGPLAPVQNLLDQVLSALPRILTAVIIGAIGWLIARIVRGIVTNMLSATGLNNIGERMGLTQTEGGLSLSNLIGTIVYVLILIPTAIAALRALEISAISDPAVSMLDQIMTTLPKIFTAGLILVVFYTIGRFVADLVASILTSVGFNNVFDILGISLPSSSDTPPAAESTPSEGSQTVLQTDESNPVRTPSEIVGILVLVGIMLLAAVAATEVLQFSQLTEIVNGVLAVSGRVVVGIIVFGVGLYFANLAFNLINSSGGRQANVLAQAARIAIIALISAMALQQMGIATSIVNLAFGLLFGAVAVALAIAFGVGGRDIAAEQIRQWMSSMRDE